MKKQIITAILGIFFAAVMSIAAGAANIVSAEIDAPDYIMRGQDVTVTGVIIFDSEPTDDDLLHCWFSCDYDSDWYSSQVPTISVSGKTRTNVNIYKVADDAQKQTLTFGLGYRDGTIATKTVPLSLETYNITYDANGGSGIMEGKTVGDGVIMTLPACGFKPPAGKVFDHWKVSGADGIYAVGNNLEIASNLAQEGVITVTAYWKNDPNPPKPTYSIIIEQPEHGKIYASATEAEVGTEITLTAVPDEGYELAEWLDYSGVIMDGDRFIMPPGNVIISAVFKMIERTSPVPNPHNEDTPAAIALPTLRISGAKVSGNTATLKWGNYPYADSFTVYMTNNGEKRKIKTTKSNSVTVTGLKNAETYRFTVAANIGKWTAPDYFAGTVTVTPYFKPLVSAKLSDGNIRLGWKGVPDAEGYIVYKLVDGKLKQIAETAGTSALITNAASGKEYVFAVSAIINGEKTGVKKSDLITVKL